MQQMTAAFCHELVHGQPLRSSAGCVTPDETALSHRLFTAALRSHSTGHDGGGMTLLIDAGLVRPGQGITTGAVLVRDGRIVAAGKRVPRGGCGARGADRRRAPAACSRRV